MNLCSFTWEGSESRAASASDHIVDEGETVGSVEVKVDSMEEQMLDDDTEDECC